MKILWIGPIVDNSTEEKQKAVSPAANKWQFQFVKALEYNDVKVINLSYCPVQVWPKGFIWISERYARNKKLMQIRVGYLNLFFIRDIFIAFNSIYHLKRDLKTNSYDFFLTYNDSFKNRIVSFYLKKKDIKYINIIADDDVVTKSDLTLFLSYDLYEKYPGRKYLLEGGIDHFVDFDGKTNDEDYLLYAGSVSPVTGIVDFVKLFKEVESHFTLRIYGKCNTKEIFELVKGDKRIKLMGYVSDKKLDEACAGAYAFINPRSNDVDSLKTFPSKLLLYLKYGKPIISAKTNTIPRKYDDFLIYYEDKKEILEEKLKELSKIDMTELNAKIKTFVEKNSWNLLVHKFIYYLNQIR